MTDVTKPIMLDETGQAIVEALGEIRDRTPKNGVPQGTITYYDGDEIPEGYEVVDSRAEYSANITQNTEIRIKINERIAERSVLSVCVYLNGGTMAYYYTSNIQVSIDFSTHELVLYTSNQYVQSAKVVINYITGGM